MTRLILAVLITPLLYAQYSARTDGDVVRLEDTAHQLRVSIVPSIGNIAFEIRVKDQNILYFPTADLQQFRARPALSGIPFLAPWANRLDEQAFYANGKRYPFDMNLGNVRGEHPIHGFLSYTDKWQVVEVKADNNAAWVTSRLDFSREPSWMAQFPFAQTYEMTYRLEGGALEVRLRVRNSGSETIPLSIGFHPYFQLTDSPREDWVIGIGAKKQWLLNADKIPTGETAPIGNMFPAPGRIPLKDFDLDHVYSDLEREPEGHAHMSVQGKAQRLDIRFGPKYNTVVVYSPKQHPGAGFVCFEPMTGITDAMNLAHRGLYKELQTLRPGETWQESFWIRPSGF
jgi:aldose 1-epimerase